jgi:hypothetical protein
MSLVNQDNFENLQAFPDSQQCFFGLFGQDMYSHEPPVPGLTSAENLILPATALTENCYNGMFDRCTNLTTAPELPATTLASTCYQSMFNGCTSLTTAPALPATALTNSCYYSMFAGCSSLTTAPDLPAEHLEEFCYAFMFDGCSSLNSIRCVALSLGYNNCTQYWVNGVAATGTFTKSAQNNEWTEGVDGIPIDWDVINEGSSGSGSGSGGSGSGSGSNAGY